MTTIMKRTLMQSMFKQGVFDLMPNATIRTIGVKVKEIKVKTMEFTTERSNMFEIETISATTPSIGVTMVTEMVKEGPMLDLKIGKLLLWMVEVIWRKIKICAVDDEKV